MFIKSMFRETSSRHGKMFASITRAPTFLYEQTDLQTDICYVSGMPFILNS